MSRGTPATAGPTGTTRRPRTSVRAPTRLPKGNTAVRVITWNANRTNRWDLLWADPLVAGLAWDVICLQEVGNPDVAHWTHAQGPVWSQDRAARDTDESFVQRRYTYQPAHYPAALHITHTEWGNRQKNHLTIITQTRPTWAAEIGGDMSDRPVLGIKVRLTLPTGPTDVLLGCVHLVANRTKSPQELGALVPYLNDMCREANAQGWLLAGDFNCSPAEMVQSAGSAVGVWYPSFSTQDSIGEPIDYVVVEPHLYQAVMAMPGISGNWERGTAASDHRLVRYTQPNGPALQVL